MCGWNLKSTRFRGSFLLLLNTSAIFDLGEFSVTTRRRRANLPDVLPLTQRQASWSGRAMLNKSNGYQRAQEFENQKPMSRLDCPADDIRGVVRGGVDERRDGVGFAGRAMDSASSLRRNDGWEE